MDLDWRPLSADDLHEWAHLLGRAAAADNLGEHYNVDDLRRQLLDPAASRVTASTGAIDEGRLVGYGLIRLRDRGQAGVVASWEGAVDPAHRGRGIGRRLVGWFRERAYQLGGDAFPGRAVQLRSHVSERTPGFARLLAGNGFTAGQWLLDLEKDLAKRGTPVLAPAGTTIAQYAALPPESIRAAYGDVFGGSGADWERLVSDPTFRPDLSYVLVDRSTVEVAAVLMASFHEADAAATGVREVSVHNLAARRNLRGRGASTALLTHAAAQYGCQGFERILLSITAEQPTPDLSLYEQAGFAVTHRWAVYTG